MGEKSVKDYVRYILSKNDGTFRIAFLGGSLSKGEKVSEEDSFVSIFEKEIGEVLSDREVQILRYGESGTMSSNGLFKVPELILEKPQLVFLDYAMNDTGDRYLWEATEGMIAQMLRAGIGVVILFFCNDRGLCTRGAMERAGHHYQIPIYDIGQKIYSDIQNGVLTWQEYAQDYVHPTIRGHRMIADDLLAIFRCDDTQDVYVPQPIPQEAAFEGAFREMKILDLREKMKKAQPGDTVLDESVSMRMILMEFYQNRIANEAGLHVFLDGKRVASAEAYASMAWGNKVCRYVGGDGSIKKYRLTVTLGKNKPPSGWNYGEFRLRFAIGY